MESKDGQAEVEKARLGAALAGWPGAADVV